MTGNRQATAPERTPVEERAVLRAIMEALNAALSGRVADAIRLLSTNRLVRSHYAGLNQLGSFHLQTGDAAKALAAFDGAVALKPNGSEAWCNRGVALQQLGRNEAALAAYEEALKHAPANVMAHFNRGNMLSLAGRFDEAATAFARAAEIDPNLFEAHLNGGVVALKRHDPEAALACFEKAVAERPNSVEAFNARAAVLQHLGRRDEALKLKRPVPVPPPPPGLEAAIGRGRALIELERYDEALAVLSRVNGRGVAAGRLAIVRAAALWKLDRSGEALAAGQEAARLAPGDADVREQFAYLCLKTGDFEHGWEEYEFRLEKPFGRMRRADFRAPVWSGEDIDGKRVVVTPEQGHGDTLQFVRYLPLLVDRGATVAAVVQKPLLALMRSMKAPVQWHDARPDEPFDFQVPLLSLAHRFATRLETIPREVPYLFADPDKVAAWRQRIGGSGVRVGVVWQGNPDYPGDPERSIPLVQFAPLAAVPGVRLISLQAVHGLGQLAHLPEAMPVETLGPAITDNPEGMSEIAAAMAALELIVTSDTAVAHLAGALGRPVWVALPHDADWRWLRARSDSPWYPTMRLFRQGKPGDWAGVFAEVASALGERAPPAG